MAAIRNLIAFSLIVILAPIPAKALVDISTDSFKADFEAALAKTPFVPARELDLVDEFLRSSGYSVESTFLQSESKEPFFCGEVDSGEDLYSENRNTFYEEFSRRLPGCEGQLFIYKKFYRNGDGEILVINLGMVEIMSETGKIRRINEDVTRICDDPNDCPSNRDSILRPRNP